MILFIGIQLGTWRHYKEVPLWGGPAFAQKPPALEGQEEEQAARRAASELEAQAKETSSAAASSSSAPPGEGQRLMRAEDDDLAKLRKKCSNS
eukprot:10592815-Lingulodinium_polyedra.AAC.1